jgi:transcriptional regulator with XRE-family HTH domain
MTPREQIITFIDDAGITRAELADRLGVTPAAVTNMLRPGHNFTVRTLERIAVALEGRLTIYIGP